MNRKNQKPSGCRILVTFVIGILVVVISWMWIPYLIRKGTTSFHSAEYFPISGTFFLSKHKYASSKNRLLPDEVGDSMLSLVPHKIEGDDNSYIMMTYQSPVIKEKVIRVVFEIEEWKHLFMLADDIEYDHNVALRAHKFYDEQGANFDFEFGCRLVGKNVSFVTLARQLSTNNKCKNLDDDKVSMNGYMRKAGLLCIDLRIRVKNKVYHIDHSSDFTQCLSKVRDLRP